MEFSVLTTDDLERRSYWIKTISGLSGDFSVDTSLVEQGISHETEQSGITPLIGHLRFCGAIPEYYDHDSSEEKLYSKYTDIVIHKAYVAIGLESTVLTERARRSRRGMCM